MFGKLISIIFLISLFTIEFILSLQFKTILFQFCTLYQLSAYLCWNRTFKDPRIQWTTKPFQRTQCIRIFCSYIVNIILQIVSPEFNQLKKLNLVTKIRLKFFWEFLFIITHFHKVNKIPKIAEEITRKVWCICSRQSAIHFQS